MGYQEQMGDNMTQASRTFRIFISSTFSDLKAERNALQDRVFPRLRTLATTHGCRFQAIDLRWGVSEEAALDQQTMKICLGEIERCRKTSPRPNFLILLGDRYGWRPLPYEIPADEFEKILHQTDVEDQLLLKQWYRRDDNAVPSIYCLLPRSDEFVEYANWEQVENRLRRVFQNAVEELKLPEEARLKFSASATEQEIMAGALKVTDASEHVFGFFRKINGLPEDESGWDYREQDRANTQKQDDLKDKLRGLLPGNIHEYTADWQSDQISLEHLDQLCEDVYANLSRVILDEVNRLDNIEPLDKEINAHTAFAEERIKVFIGREDVLSEIDSYIHTGEPHPLVIWGASGSGKTALIARAVEGAKTATGDVICRFIGATPEPSNIRALLESLCQQITRQYDPQDKKIPTEYKDLIQDFPKRLALARPEKPLVIFLDALDQLSDSENARKLTWLPANLPPNVRLIVSTLPGECLQALEGKVPESNRIQVNPMSIEEGNAILAKWLHTIGRTLQEAQKNLVMENFSRQGFPLYLKLAFEEARQWKSYDKVGLNEDIPGVLNDLFERLSLESNHGAVLVSRSLGYLSAAKNGLTEDELLDVLSSDTEEMSDFQRRSPKSPKLDQLPAVIWSRIYFDLEPYLSEKSADDTFLLGFYHRQMAEVAQSKFLSKIHHTRLADYFTKKPLAENGDGGAPNQRKLTEWVYQLVQADLNTQAEAVLSDYSFIEAKLKGQGVFRLVDDFNFFLEKAPASQNKETIQMIRDAVQLSSPYLEKDYRLLPSQLTGRLLEFTQPQIRDLIEQIPRRVGYPWLRPLSQCYTPPGGPLIRTLVGHKEQINAVCVSPDGEKVISAAGKGYSGIYGGASSDNTIKIWDIEDGSCLLTLPGSSQGITALCIDPHGKFLVSASNDFTIRIWDIEEGKEIKVLQNHKGVVDSVILTPDGKKLISTSIDMTVKVWETETFTLLFSIDNFYQNGHVCISHAGNRLAVRLRGDIVKIYNLEDGNPIAAIPCLGNPMSFSPDDTKIIVVSNALGNFRNSIFVWDIEPPKETFRFEGHSGAVYGIQFTPDHQKMISAGADKTLRVWDWEKHKELFTLSGHKSSVTSLVVTTDGKGIISASEDKSIKCWDIESGTEIASFDDHQGRVLSMKVTPDGKKLVSGSTDMTVKIWNLSNRNNPTASQKNMGMDSICIVPQTAKVVCAMKDFSLRIFQHDTGQLTGTLNEHKAKISHLLPFDEGKKMVTASIDGVIIVWDLERRERLYFLQGLEMSRILSVSRDEKKLYSASNPGLQIWDLKNGNELNRIEWDNPNNSLQAILSVDHQVFIKASADHTLNIWNLNTGKLTGNLTGHAAPIQDIALFSDGRKLIMRSSDRSLKIWDLDSKREVFSHQSQADFIESMALSPDDRFLYTAAVNQAPTVLDLVNNQVFMALDMTDISRVLFTPDSKKMVFMYINFRLNIWSLETKSELVSLSLHDGEVFHFTRDSQILAYFNNDINITRWRNGRGLAGGSGTMTIKGTNEKILNIWNLAENQSLCAFYGDSDFKKFVMGDDMRLAGFDAAGRVYLLQLENVNR